MKAVFIANVHTSACGHISIRHVHTCTHEHARVHTHYYACSNALSMVVGALLILLLSLSLSLCLFIVSLCVSFTHISHIRHTHTHSYSLSPPPPPPAVHSEANTRRIHIVEQCFGSSGQVGNRVIFHLKTKLSSNHTLYVTHVHFLATGTTNLCPSFS